MTDRLHHHRAVPRTHDPAPGLGRLRLAVGVGSALGSAAIVAVGIGLAQWQAAFGLGVWGTGAVSASLTAAIATGALVGGRVADLTGRRRVFTASLLVVALGAGVVAAAPSAPYLVVGVVVLGLGSGADLPASLTELSTRAPAGTAGRLVAGSHVLWTLGVVVTGAAGLVVSTRGLAGTRAVFVVIALVALATGVLRLLPAPTLPTADPVADLARGGRAAGVPSWRALLTNPASRRALLLTGGFHALYTLVANTFGSFKTYVLVTVGGTSQTSATALVLGAGVVGLAGTLVFARIADTPWRRRVFPWGIGLYAVALTLLAAAVGSSPALVVVALVLQSTAFPFVGDAVYKVSTQEAFDPRVRATAQGATTAVARLGAAAFALVTPALLRWQPSVLFGLLLLLLAGAGLLGSRLGWVRGPRER